MLMLSSSKVKEVVKKTVLHQCTPMHNYLWSIKVEVYRAVLQIKVVAKVNFTNGKGTRFENRAWPVFYFILFF